MKALAQLVRHATASIAVAAALVPTLGSAACIGPTGNTGDLGVLSGSACFNSGGVLSGGTSFTDFFTFTVASPETVTTNVSLNINPSDALGAINLSLWAGTVANLGSDTQIGSTVVGNGSPLSASLVSGQQYFYEVFGNISGTPSTASGSFTGNVTVSAVPEPGAWAMMAAGILVLAGVARRRSIG